MNGSDHSPTRSALPDAVFRQARAQALPLGLAVSMTIAVFASVAALAPDQSALRTFLLDRGFTQPLTLLLALWGMGHALRRLWLQRWERAALRECQRLLRAVALDRNRVEPLQVALHGLEGSLAGDVLASIVSYFRGNRPTRDEVLKVAGREMDRAADRVDDEYAPLQALLWLIPLSGFLGTVLGMSAAIDSFDVLVGAQEIDLSLLMPAVKGLAVAFDTTLLALALVVPLKVVEVAVQRRDRAILDAVDRAVGTGLVRELDLAGLAQQTPEERVFDGYAETLERIRESLGALDRMLLSITARVGTVSQLERSLEALGEASRAVRDAVPAIRSDLNAMRRQSEQPLTLVRGGGGPTTSDGRSDGRSGGPSGTSGGEKRS